MAKSTSTRRGGTGKTLVDPQALGQTAGNLAADGGDGQGGAGDPPPASGGSGARIGPSNWGEALGLIEPVAAAEVQTGNALTLIVVPFDEHPELYSRNEFGARVVTGETFHARTDDGRTIEFH